MILIALLGVAALSAGGDQPASDMDRAMVQLQGTPAEQKTAVDHVLTHATAAPAPLMYLAAARSLDLGRLGDAGFLYYAAQLRARFDLKRFPPVDKGGDSPAVALSALSYQVGSAVNPAVMREPVVFKTVIEKVRAWDVTPPPGYDPGWTYATPSPPADARALAASVKADYLRPAEGLVTLLNTPEYFTAWKTVQDANFAPFDGKPHPERAAARETAEKRLREIEQRLGIEGLFYRKNAPPPATLPAMPAAAPPTPTPPAPPPALDRAQAIAQLKARGYPRPNDADQYVGLAFTGQEDLVRLFLAAGVPVDAPNSLGDHALLMAIQGSYIDLAAELLKAGANPNLPDQNGYTPLIQIASFCDESALVAALIQAGGNVKARANNGKTPLSVARETGCTEIARLLKTAGAVQ